MIKGKERSKRMNDKRQLLPGLAQTIGILALIVLFSSSCGALQPAPTPTPLSPTQTPTPMPTPTQTPVPGAVVSGRIYLMDRDRSVQTTVLLVREDPYSEIARTVSDEGGYYSFFIEEPGTYIVQVSVMDLIGFNCNPRTESGWPGVYQQYDTSGVSDILAGSTPFSISIGDEITLDCELYCN
jgi:hypothetical protein